MTPQRIIISRTDNLGDVMLTLPLAGVLKKKFPACTVFFIGKSYTKALIQSSQYIDVFLDREELLKNPRLLADCKADCILHIFPDKEIAKLAKQVNIPLRIGTSHRWFHWLYCNKRINFSRKNSTLHEAQLNLALLQPLGITEVYSLPVLNGFLGFTKVASASANFPIDSNKINLVFHPKSKGSAREWPMQNYFELAKLLPSSLYAIYITGTAAEGLIMHEQCPPLFVLPHIVDVTGKCTMDELVGLISKMDGLVACSTGPLHIASSLQINALGLYPPMRPIHPGRWAPIGAKASVLVENKECDACRKTQNCACIRAISPQQVKAKIDSWKK